MEPRSDDQPPSIPGIDSAEFLERIGEDMDLFWEVLGEFSTSYRDTTAQIAANPSARQGPNWGSARAAAIS